jgi:plasmid maintenance system antidote protein VapI
MNAHDKNLNVVPFSPLRDVLDAEIAQHCHRKLTKRMALKLARAFATDSRYDIFLAEEMVKQLLPRITRQAEVVRRNMAWDR